MELGWIDFSKNERNKVLSVLDLLDEKGVLDELGIAPIRDAYSDLFFPGTSTIQTRAKYFFIVPYVFRDLEFNSEFEFTKLKKSLDDCEKQCARIFLENNPNEDGVIGSRAIQNNSWVKRTPSNIYWAGLRKYGIFKSKMSIDQYIRFVLFKKLEKSNINNMGNRNDEYHDDKYAGDNLTTHYFNIPSYTRNWKDNLDFNLTFDEGQFLKQQIITNCPGSIIAHVLKNNIYEFVDIPSFNDLKDIIFKFPQDIQKNFMKAKLFSEFNYALSVVYNLIVSDNKNKEANNAYSSLDFNEISQIGIDEIMNSLNIFNPNLRKFLMKSKEAMQNDDLEELKNIIRNREIYLKGINRSKTAHVGEFGSDEWFAGRYLNYRFDVAKTIISDIFESEWSGD